MDHWLMFYGIPTYLLTNTVSQFLNDLFKIVCILLEFGHLTTMVVPYTDKRPNHVIQQDRLYSPPKLRGTSKGLEYIRSSDRVRLRYAGLPLEDADPFQSRPQLTSIGTHTTESLQHAPYQRVCQKNHASTSIEIRSKHRHLVSKSQHQHGDCPTKLQARL